MKIEITKVVEVCDLCQKEIGGERHAYDRNMVMRGADGETCRVEALCNECVEKMAMCDECGLWAQEWVKTLDRSGDVCPHCALRTINFYSAQLKTLDEERSNPTCQ